MNARLNKYCEGKIKKNTKESKNQFKSFNKILVKFNVPFV